MAMRWLRAGLGVVIVSLTIGSYIVAPLWTAWSIREAVHANDSAYLERKIEWDSVRSSLKASLVGFSISASGELKPTVEKPSLWQQLMSSLGHGAIDQFVNATVTPTGMSGLLKMRKAYHANADDAAARPPLLTRLRHVWSHITRAEFLGFTTFDMDMIDRDAPERTINCTLELKGFEWKLTQLRVKLTDPVQAQRFKGLQAAAT